jgi:membrane associated rhomboid family serine protease
MSKIIDDIKFEYKIGGIANKFIYWNVAIFLLSLLFFNFRNLAFLFPNWLQLSSNPEIAVRNIWTLITYAFLHDGFWHLFCNMLVLNFAGRLFSTFFNDKQFVGLYILSAIFAGICFIIGFNILGLSSEMVGASAATMAILVATTSYSPLMNIRLLIIGNVKLWHLTAVILLLDFMSVLADNSGGHIAHLSGAFFGYLFVQLLKNGIDMSTIVTKTIDFFANLFGKKQKTPFKKVHKNYNKPAAKPVSKIILKDKSQQQIDEILDKISKSGYDSLTTDEKEFLFKAGKE